MMMRQGGRIVALGGAGVALLLGVTVAAAQPLGHGGEATGHGPGRHGPQAMARYLELTEEQQAKVRETLEQQRPQLEALRGQMRANREQLDEALKSADPDPSTVGELVIKGHRLREKGRALREEADRAIRGVLTPEQQKKFDALKAARNMGGPWAHRGPRPGFDEPPEEP